MKVVVSIPAYNEEQTLGRVLTDIKKVMAGLQYEYVISIVDDGSTDKTAEIARQHGASVYSHPYNCGLAEAFRSEISKAISLGADIIVHTDADGQYPAEEIPKLLQEINNGADLVLGSRFLGRIESMPLLKRAGNMAFSKAISQITRAKITDAQTGFRAFTKKVAQIKIISNHTYTQEQVIRALKNRYIVKEVPITARKTRESRLMRSHPLVQPFEYAVKAWINLFRIYRDFEPLKFFGYFGAGFFIAGAILGAWLIYLFARFGRIGHLPSTILTMLLIITAIQIWLFGFLADMIKHEK